MPRRFLLRRHGATARFALRMAIRQGRLQRMHATTPLAFLRRLGMLAPVEPDAGWREPRAARQFVLDEEDVLAATTPDESVEGPAADALDRGLMDIEPVVAPRSSERAPTPPLAVPPLGAAPSERSDVRSEPRMAAEVEARDPELEGEAPSHAGASAAEPPPEAPPEAPGAGAPFHSSAGEPLPAMAHVTPVASAVQAPLAPTWRSSVAQAMEAGLPPPPPQPDAPTAVAVPTIEPVPPIVLAAVPAGDGVAAALTPEDVSEPDVVSQPAPGAGAAAVARSPQLPIAETPPAPEAARHIEPGVVRAPVRRARVEEIGADRLSGVPQPPRPAPEPPRERAADRLFEPVHDEVDRSPAAWARRLAAALQPAPEPPRTVAARSRDGAARTGGPRAPVSTLAAVNARPATSGPPAEDEAIESDHPLDPRGGNDIAPVVLTSGARRFLAPLVGVDPASVPILRGPGAERAVSGQHADALALGDAAVLVGRGFNPDTPAGMGLLAHELTHVARQRHPRFIPAASRHPAATPMGVGGEEAIAQAVEARAIELASAPATSASVLETASAPGQPAAFETPATLEPPPIQMETLPSGEWNGLPAPWEPLPGWLTGEAPPPGAPALAPAPARRSVIPAAAAPASAAVPAPGAAPVQRAEEGRVLEPAKPAAGAADEPKAPAPDLDLLARQVYAALKRRLEADRRREHSF